MFLQPERWTGWASVDSTGSSVHISPSTIAFCYLYCNNIIQLHACMPKGLHCPLPAISVPHRRAHYALPPPVSPAAARTARCAPPPSECPAAVRTAHPRHQSAPLPLALPINIY